MADNQPMYHKFDVRRVDGRDAPGEKHHGCRYLVIDLDHDEQAIGILSAAIRLYRKTRPDFAESLTDLMLQVRGERIANGTYMPDGIDAEAAP